MTEDITWESVCELYLSGSSTRQIAAITGLCPSVVAKVVKTQGISRSHSTAAQLRHPPRSKHWRSSRSAARKKVERSLGRKLESDEHVHHVDHDYTNNSDANLAVLNASEHAKHHHPKNPIPRGQRPERKDYQKKYWESTRITRICEECGEAFHPFRLSATRFCGNSCSAFYKWRIRRAAKA